MARRTPSVRHAYNIRTPSVQDAYTIRTISVHQAYTIRTPSVHHIYAGVSVDAVACIACEGGLSPYRQWPIDNGKWQMTNSWVAARAANLRGSRIGHRVGYLLACGSYSMNMANKAS